MLNANLVERADDRALEETPNAFDTVGVNVTNYPFKVSMADAFVSRVVVSDAEIGTQFVGIERFGFVLGDRGDEGMNRGFLDIGDASESDLPAALQRTSNVDALVTRDAATTALPVFGIAPVGNQHRFVEFDDSKESGASVQRLHRFADTMAEIPRGFVSGAERSLHLVGAHGFLALDHEIDSGKPLPERKLGVVEDRSRRDREAVAASVTVELIPSRDLRHGIGLTPRTDRATGPAEFEQVVAANFFGAEAVHNVNKTDRLLPIELFVFPNVGLIGNQ